MSTTYDTKLFLSVLDCGCSLSLGEFAQEADLEDVERWLNERGYRITRDPARAGEPATKRAAFN